MTNTLWTRLARNRLLDVGVVLIAIFVVVAIGSVLPIRANRIDFAHYYASSRLLWEGKSPYSTRLAPLYEKYGFVVEKENDTPKGTNPPPLLWLFAPLTLLSPRPAFVAWVVVQAVSLCALLWMTRCFLRDRLSPRGWFFVCAAAVASTTVYWHFYYSQVQLLLAALVLAGYGCHRAGKSTAACLLVTSAGLIKLYPLVLLPWFVWSGRGRVRHRIGRIILVLLFGAVVVVMTGIGLWHDFFTLGLGLVTDLAVNSTINFSLPSLLTNLDYAAYGFTPPASVAHASWLAGVSVGLICILLAYLSCYLSSSDPEIEFCLLSVAMLAGSITTWPHYFVFLIFPMAVVALRVAAHPSGSQLLGFALLMIVFTNLGIPGGASLDRHIYLKILVNYLPLYGLLALGIFLAKELGAKRVRQA